MPKAMKFDVHGHRGARGLKPENTLPAFEAALDLEVTTLEADIHLTSDGVPVVFHDKTLDARLVSLLPGTAGMSVGWHGQETVPQRGRYATAPVSARRLWVSELSAVQLRGFRVDKNPDPVRFPQQDNRVTPVASDFARREQMDPLNIPTLAELLAFVAAYAGEMGRANGKTDSQQRRAREVRFSLELKRVPFRPENIGDVFDGSQAGDLEKTVVNAVRQAGVETRTIVQSFDHRSVCAARALEPKLLGAALIYNTVPISIERMCHDASAQTYSPNYEFLDARQIRMAHAAGIRVVPWTVNDAADMRQLIDWGVDGIITDYPDRLIAVLRMLCIDF